MAALGQSPVVALLARAPLRGRGAAMCRLLQLCLTPLLLHAEVSQEYHIKAAFLYNFTKYVTWSPQRVRTPDSPIVIGVLGKDPFDEVLTSLVRNRSVDGRAIVVKAVGGLDEAANLDLLFVPAGEEHRLAAGLASINAAGVLTVGESEQFAALGGMITFTLQADKVRFEINRAVTERSGLKLSGQLLKLAASASRKT